MKKLLILAVTITFVATAFGAFAAPIINKNAPSNYELRCDNILILAGYESMCAIHPECCK